MGIYRIDRVYAGFNWFVHNIIALNLYLRLCKDYINILCFQWSDIQGILYKAI